MLYLILTLIAFLTTPVWALDAPIFIKAETGAQCSNASGSDGNFYTKNMLEWNNVAGATKYILQGKASFAIDWEDPLATNPPPTQKLLESGARSYNHPSGNILPNTYYLYRVFAVDNVGTYSLPSRNIIIYVPPDITSAFCTHPNDSKYGGFELNEDNMMDTGIKVYENGATKKVSVLPPGQLSKLKVRKYGTTFNVALLDPLDPLVLLSATKLSTRVKTSTGVRVLRNWDIAGCAAGCLPMCVPGGYQTRTCIDGICEFTAIPPAPHPDCP